jgi:hypothetical protein
LLLPGVPSVDDRVGGVDEGARDGASAHGAPQDGRSAVAHDDHHFCGPGAAQGLGKQPLGRRSGALDHEPHCFDELRRVVARHERAISRAS